MKRLFLVFVLVFTLFMPFILQGEYDKQYRIFADLGFASSDFKGLFVDGGIEFGFSRYMGVQVLVNYYFDPYGKEEPEDINVTANSLNLYFVGRIQAGKKLNFFGKIGGNFTSIKESFGAIARISSDFGIGVGCGFEYMLKRHLGIQGGTSFKYVFVTGDNIQWYQFYLGVVYKLKEPTRWSISP